MKWTIYPKGEDSTSQPEQVEARTRKDARDVAVLLGFTDYDIVPARGTVAL